MYPTPALIFSKNISFLLVEKGGISPDAWSFESKMLLSVGDWRSSWTCWNYSLFLPSLFCDGWKMLGCKRSHRALTPRLGALVKSDWHCLHVLTPPGILDAWVSESCGDPEELPQTQLLANLYLVNLLGWTCFVGEMFLLSPPATGWRQRRVADGLVALMPWHYGTRLASQGTQVPGKSFSLGGLWNPQGYHGHPMEIPIIQNGPDEWFVFWEDKLGKMSLLNSRRSKPGQSFSLNPSFAEMIWPQGAVKIDCKAAEPFTWARLQPWWVFNTWIHRLYKIIAHLP